MELRFGHICPITNQIDALREFYNDRLQMKEKWRVANGSGSLTGYCVVFSDGTEIEMFNANGAAALSGNKVAHVCFRVTAIEPCKVWLESRGVVIVEYKKGAEIWIADPDGNKIEIRE